MRHHTLQGCLLACLAVLAWPAHAAGIEATLDQSVVVVNMGAPTVLKVTLRNTGTQALYLTGIEVSLSEGAAGALYEPTPLQDKLRKLDIGETWNGPLVVITPNHKGPLLIKGFIHLKGGERSGATTLLTSIPVYLTINDPRRQTDGSYTPEAVPACDRTAESCCDPSEQECFQIQGHCLYVAQGHDHQIACIDQQAGHPYEKIFNLNVSSDGAHRAYLAADHCLTGGLEEHCRRTMVIDSVEKLSPETPAHLQLSPDGQHYAYGGFKQCVWRSGQEVCSGTAHPYVDGVRAKAFPFWYRHSLGTP